MMILAIEWSMPMQNELWWCVLSIVCTRFHKSSSWMYRSVDFFFFFAFCKSILFLIFSILVGVNHFFEHLFVKRNETRYIILTMLSNCTHIETNKEKYRHNHFARQCISLISYLTRGITNCGFEVCLKASMLQPRYMKTDLKVFLAVILE